MNIYSFPAIAAFVINVTMAFVIFFGNPKSTVNRWISAFVLSFALWNISEIFILASGNQEGGMLAAQILYRVIFVIPAIYVVSAYNFPRSVSRITGSVFFYTAVFLIPVAFLVSSFPHFHIELVSLSSSRTVYFYRIVIRQDFQSISLLATYFAYLVWGSLVMIRKIPELRTTTQKRRARMFLYGGLIYLFFSVLLFIVERFAQTTLYFYTSSTILSFVVSGFFAAAVLSGRMFDSPHTIRGGVAYSLASSIILAIYFLGVQAVTEGLLNYLKISSYAANALFVFVLVLLIRPLESRIRKTLDNLMSRDLNRYRHNMVAFSRAISIYLPPDEFFRRVETFLLRQFHIQNVLILLKGGSPEEPRFSEWKDGPGGLQLKDDCFLVQHLKRVKRPVEFYDIDRRNIDGGVGSILESKGVRLLFPLLSADELIGVLAISVRKSGQEFTAEMIDALSIFANEVATAYQRNLAIENMREKEQEEFRVRHLASLGQLTAGVAHEIRNPLNVMSASAQTLLKKELSKDEEKELKQFIVDEADRLNKILTDFLSLSKLRAPKNENVSLQEILEKARAAILSTAGNIDVEISPRSIPATISTDHDLMYQLLFNLGINAVEAIKERCKSDNDFDCAEGIVSFSAASGEGGLEISVSDNGIGISEDNRDKVFEPFYTTKDTGTGLGLSISHNIADALGGKIRIISRKGETIFTIRFENMKEYA
ncbi:MAG: ATP-binding protein [Bacteroidetes bacterium]|nr:ATP-binding protein [Bacteroidota bacterium]